jgi:PHD/YefM family antitoxin component YafN of YafNO toxin-antitoxin module
MITTRKPMRLNPQIIEKRGRKEFVVLPYEEYQAIEELMEDYMDLIDLREAKAEGQGQPSVPLDEVINELKKG